MQLSEITIGCDPEVFLVNSDGKTTSAIDLIGGTKKAPLIINKKLGLGVLEDNVTLELNLNHAATSREFIDNVSECKRYLTRWLREKGYSYTASSVGTFPMEQLDTPKANVSGCDPDFDAYTRGTKRMPLQLKLLGDKRFAGGHLHFGYDVQSCLTPHWAIAQFLDAFALLYWNQNFSSNTLKRREHYGAPGIYRPKPYGIEYRTPGPEWMNLSSNDILFIGNCHSIVAGIIADPAATRAEYDSIDWKQLQRVLSTATSPSSTPVVRLQMAFEEVRQGMFARGSELLTKINNERRASRVGRMIEMPDFGGIPMANAVDDMANRLHVAEGEF